MDRSDLAYRIGADVGSTTVKAVVREVAGDRIVWHDYQRHNTRQGEVLLEFLRRMEQQVGITPLNSKLFITGSGGGSLAGLLGGKFVQEVTAVALTVERLYPKANSVVELGGQDAKIIVFVEQQQNGRKKKIPTMNDKCAGGTGAVIDRICAKLGWGPADLARHRYNGTKLHPVAGKCGVFAETDINSLQKQGVPAEELMASLLEALVLQNLTVLTRGNTLLPQVLLLGGPHFFIPGLCEAWRRNIGQMWKERGVAPPATPEELIYVPQDAHYFGAIGATEFGKQVEEESTGQYQGTAALEEYLATGCQEEKARSGIPGLRASGEALETFHARFAPRPFEPAVIAPGHIVSGFVGLDVGSTSTKAVFLSEQGEVLSKAYQLSRGSPIQDSIEVLQALARQVEGRGAQLEVRGVVTTGYAKDILREVLCADAALVETVAHTQSALRFCPQVEVIVDVGGQDIKLLVLRDGRVKDFRLNTQCSAGNGYFLQATAEGLGIPVDRYAEVALSAARMPLFGYGCAVFLQTDVVNYQRQGWRTEEILAGLAAVLPKNIFLYVAGVPNLARLGKRFVLQGGTQKNLAVVKAEVDFIRSHFNGSDGEPEILVNEHCGEAGAIGAALEAIRLWREGRRTSFIGLEAVRNISYRTTRNEGTRCHFCKNACLRTFLDIQTGAGVQEAAAPPVSRRLIVATCEKGSVEESKQMREVRAKLDAVRAANPNLLELAAREVWKPRRPPAVADLVPGRMWMPGGRERMARMKQRERLRVGIPRVLYLYFYAPLFSAYLESLGVRPGNIVYSDFTSNELYRSGCNRGAIDPCFPSKVALAHVHNLIYVKHSRRPLDCIFFPMFDTLCTPLENVLAAKACPTTTVTPEAVKAAFTKEADVFALNSIRFMNPLVSLAERPLFARQMFRAWAPVLGLSEEENARALEVAFEEQHRYEAELRRQARQVLDRLEAEGKLGIVLLGRPYHHDPGLNHGIPEMLQKHGYAVFSQNTLPLDADLLDRLFGEEVRAGHIPHPLDISDVWKNTFSGSSNHKLWAAKFTARHPNLVAVELSNFKCGHDAAIYSTVEQIIESSGTPYFCFKDLDENKPLGAIRIRVETIDYFLRQYAAERLRPGRPGSSLD
jgi:predicted CoA-substrate-specific enzyme activase